MVDREEIMDRVREQAEKKWDTESIGAWLSRLSKEGIPSSGISLQEAVRRKQEVLDGIQRRAEDCTYVSGI
jgi:hypothetical protein